MTLYRQVGLKSGTTELVANLRDSPKLKAGNALTLRDHPNPERWWNIEWVADVVRERPNTRWDVGGI